MRGKSNKTEKILGQFGEALKDIYGDYGEMQGEKQPWETEAWIADNPTHMIHFNGDKFLGPHKE